MSKKSLMILAAGIVTGISGHIAYIKYKERNDSESDESNRSVSNKFRKPIDDAEYVYLLSELDYVSSEGEGAEETHDLVIHVKEVNETVSSDDISDDENITFNMNEIMPEVEIEIEE